MIFKCFGCGHGINIFLQKYVIWREGSTKGNTNQRTVEDLDMDHAFLRWHEGCYLLPTA